MNILRKSYNWVFGIKSEPKPIPVQKMSRSFRQCVYAIANKLSPTKNGYSKPEYSAKKGSPSHPPMPQTEFHERVDTNWQNRMDSQEKKMTRGAQNIFNIIKGRFNWGNKNLWRRCDKKKPSATKYGKPHRGHDN